MGGFNMKIMIKVFSIFFLLLFFLMQACFATDINMNLPLEEENQNVPTSQNTFQNTTSSENEMQENIEEDVSTPTQTPSTVVGPASSVPDQTLGLTSILNILLIVIGIVLILLAIAILIRMHS